MRRVYFRKRLNSLSKEDDEVLKDAKRYDCPWSVPYDFSDSVLEEMIKEEQKEERFWNETA